MDLYKTMYLGLFNAVTDALNALEQEDSPTAREVLILAQQRAEEAYIEAEEDVPPQRKRLLGEGGLKAFPSVTGGFAD
jgi:hypothetical protein